MKSLEGRSALWFAEIETEGLDETLAIQRANFAVDIALSALHLVLPSYASRDVARLTGRARPDYVGTFFTIPTNGTVKGGVQKILPNLTISAEFFHHVMTHQRELIDSIGRRVDAYLRDKRHAPKLEKAWSDAAFWMHEGFAELVPTVAIAKLETAVEVLFCAESRKGSGQRFYEAFKSYWGLSPNDQLHSDLPLTVKSFVGGIVSARSQVLHGTQPTLSHDEFGTDDEMRQALEFLVVEFIGRYTQALDRFLASPELQDDAASLLNWIEKERTTAA